MLFRITAMLWLHLHYSSAFHDFSNFHPNLSCTYIILLPHDKKTQTKEEQWPSLDALPNMISKPRMNDGDISNPPAHDPHSTGGINAPRSSHKTASRPSCPATDEHIVLHDGARIMTMPAIRSNPLIPSTSVSSHHGTQTNPHSADLSVSWFWV